MPTLNATTWASFLFSLSYLLIWGFLCCAILLIFWKIVIFIFLIPWSVITLFLTFSFETTFFYFPILTNIWTVWSKMTFLITTITNNIWQIVAWWSCVLVWWFILRFFLSTSCWVCWFVSGLIWLLAIRRTIICIMTSLFAAITYNGRYICSIICLIIIVLRSWCRIWVIWLWFKLQNVC